MPPKTKRRGKTAKRAAKANTPSAPYEKPISFTEIWDDLHLYGPDPSQRPLDQERLRGLTVETFASHIPWRSTSPMTLQAHGEHGAGLYVVINGNRRTATLVLAKTIVEGTSIGGKKLKAILAWLRTPTAQAILGRDPPDSAALESVTSVGRLCNYIADSPNYKQAHTLAEDILAGDGRSTDIYVFQASILPSDTADDVVAVARLQANESAAGAASNTSLDIALAMLNDGATADRIELDVYKLPPGLNASERKAQCTIRFADDAIVGGMGTKEQLRNFRRVAGFLTLAHRRRHDCKAEINALRDHIRNGHFLIKDVCAKKARPTLKAVKTPNAAFKSYLAYINALCDNRAVNPTASFDLVNPAATLSAPTPAPETETLVDDDAAADDTTSTPPTTLATKKKRKATADSASTTTAEDTAAAKTKKAHAADDTASARRRRNEDSDYDPNEPEGTSAGTPQAQKPKDVGAALPTRTPGQLGGPEKRRTTIMVKKWADVSCAAAITDADDIHPGDDYEKHLLAIAHGEISNVAFGAPLGSRQPRPFATKNMRKCDIVDLVPGVISFNDPTDTEATHISFVVPQKSRNAADDAPAAAPTTTPLTAYLTLHDDEPKAQQPAGHLVPFAPEPSFANTRFQPLREGRFVFMAVVATSDIPVSAPLLAAPDARMQQPDMFPAPLYGDSNSGTLYEYGPPPTAAWDYASLVDNDLNLTSLVQRDPNVVYLPNPLQGDIADLLTYHETRCRTEPTLCAEDNMPHSHTSMFSTDAGSNVPKTLTTLADNNSIIDATCVYATHHRDTPYVPLRVPGDAGAPRSGDGSGNDKKEGQLHVLAVPLLLTAPLTFLRGAGTPPAPPRSNDPATQEPTTADVDFNLPDHSLHMLRSNHMAILFNNVDPANDIFLARPAGTAVILVITFDPAAL